MSTYIHCIKTIRQKQPQAMCLCVSVRIVSKGPKYLVVSVRKHVMFVYFPGMDERSVTHGDSAMLLVVVVAFFFGGFFNVLVVCWG